MDRKFGQHIHLDEKYWTIEGGIGANGKAFFEDELLKEKGLIDLFSDVGPEKLPSLASKLNGLFSVVYFKDDVIAIVSDHVGSRVLFYSLDQDIFVSDSFSVVRSKVGESPIPEDRRLEFLMATFVSGEETLDPNIYKTTPGTVLYLNLEKKSTEVKQYFLHRGNLNPVSEDKVEELYPKWKEVLHDVFERMVEVASGRQIKLGLSGGYDSRLIAMMLDRVGYDDVLLYTSNKGGHYGEAEVKVARKIAEDTGYEWFERKKHLELTKKNYESKKTREKIQKLCKSGMASTTISSSRRGKNVKEKDISGKGVIKTSGTQLFSPFMPWNMWFRLKKRSKIDKKVIVEGIFKNQYKRYDFEKDEIKRVKNRIASNISSKKIFSPREAFVEMERWYWRERNPNRLSLRISYLSADERWYPLLDKEIVEFWDNIPMNLRYNKRLHERWIDRLYEETYGKKRPDSRDVREKLKLQSAGPISSLFIQLENSFVGKIVKGSNLSRYARTIVDLIHKSKKEDLMEILEEKPELAFVDPKDFKEQYTGSQGKKYFSAYEILKRLE